MMIKRQSSEGSACNPYQLDEITITVEIGSAACYVGSKEQILAEGVVPSDVAWPDRTSDYTEWQEGSNVFRLRRAQPEGMKLREWRKRPVDLWRVGIGFAAGIGEPQSRYDERHAAIDRIFSAPSSDPCQPSVTRTATDDAFRTFLSKIHCLTDNLERG
ncbi:hypothetical protein K6Y54_13665 [Burkholderia cenocepacia]|nr:hypothetical protein [Burkholderia cenocepacia]